MADHRYRPSQFTIQGVVEGQHEEISEQDGDVIPHQMLLQCRCRGHAGSVNQLEDRTHSNNLL